MTSATLRRARNTARRYGEQIARDKVREALERHGVRASHRRTRLRLWLPVSLLWLFFPLVILIAPLALAWRGSPARLIAAVASLLASLPGALVEVQSLDADIHIRLF